ncbi:nucleoside-diphosphate-sugar epimerase [Kitasatospora sp. SolWspMP-SS2h]|uniref:NAD-dependent epimerase/dehydratase family protein n=1 Tax=Kitasatospora sp. SolWspMP-SS2h TaxID=1305729 RepID=UPI000DBA2292|nr:NAD-dependent epimerase/dehydratase family protein [Kitasatospora sp. SolWspMP-SS2h]RAJ41771.1 nucleoside-diphosphate-sugar epimerase [Kitasatospora sp. SolWspMP-SS2h]
MSSLYVVVGAGATGAATALLLARAGERVRLVTRRGAGPVHPLIERIAADATDPVRLAGLASGAAALVNCAMPPYHRWPEEFPALAAGLLGAAERTGAGYVMLGNVYGYGPVDGPFTEDLPLRPSSVKGEVRARIWADALAAHRAGRVRATEVRAGDFLGAGAVSPFTLLVAAPVLAGRPVAYPGDPDAAHSWTYTGDAARALVAAARDERSWGRAWHVPSASHAPARELAVRLARLAGAPAPRLDRMSTGALAGAARADAVMAEVPEMLYLYDRPALIDSTATETALGLPPATPLDTALAETAAR